MLSLIQDGSGVDSSAREMADERAREVSALVDLREDGGRWSCSYYAGVCL